MALGRKLCDRNPFFLLDVSWPRPMSLSVQVRHFCIPLGVCPGVRAPIKRKTVFDMLGHTNRTGGQAASRLTNQDHKDNHPKRTNAQHQHQLQPTVGSG